MGPAPIATEAPPVSADRLPLLTEVLELGPEVAEIAALLAVPEARAPSPPPAAPSPAVVVPEAEEDPVGQMLWALGGEAQHRDEATPAPEAPPLFEGELAEPGSAVLGLAPGLAFAPQGPAADSLVDLGAAPVATSVPAPSVEARGATPVATRPAGAGAFSLGVVLLDDEPAPRQAEAPAAAPPAPMAAPAADPVTQLLAELAPRIDALFETRLREALAPALARAAEGLIRDARQELAATLREMVQEAVARSQQSRRPEA